jgi:hypothetical protein
MSAFPTELALPQLNGSFVNGLATSLMVNAHPRDAPMVCCHMAGPWCKITKINNNKALTLTLQVHLFFQILKNAASAHLSVCYSIISLH